MKIEVKKDISLIDFVLEIFPQVSVTKAKKMILYNCFSLRGADIKSFEFMLSKGDVVEYRKYSGGKHIANERRSVAVLYEDEFVLLATKSFGVKVVDNKSRKKEDMISEVKRYVHRRHRNAAVYVVFAPEDYESGLCMFSKNKYAYETMKQQADKMIFEVDSIVCAKPKYKSESVRLYIREVGEKYEISRTEQEGWFQYNIKYETIEDLSYGDKDFYHIRIEHEGYKPLLVRQILKYLDMPVLGDVRFDRQETKNILKFFYSSIRFEKIINGANTKVSCKLPNSFETFNCVSYRTMSKQDDMVKERKEKKLENKDKTRYNDGE